MSAASTTPLASKHSSLGPLPIFPRSPRHHTLSRQSSLSSSLGSVIAAQEDGYIREPEPQPRHSEDVCSVEGEAHSSGTPTPPFAPPTKSRPTLASFFQAAGRKALRRDEFRKNSYSREAVHDEGYLSQSLPSTPLRRRFLGLKASNLADTIRSARSNTPVPSVPSSSSNPIPTPSLPLMQLVTPKGKENHIPPSPMLKRKRSSLPTTPKKSVADEHYHIDASTEREATTGQTLRPSPDEFSSTPHPMRRSKSDSKRNKRSHSPGQATSIRVPGPPPQHHPHPHPFFPCDTPLDRGLLTLPSFDFERPGTRPSTPRQSQEFLPMDRTKRSRSKTSEADPEMNAEIRSVLAAGAEARRERRAPSRERLRVIEPLHRQHLPDVTGGDDQLSPDPSPIPIPGSTRSRTHVSHGLLPFESPAATPYENHLDLPLLTPQPSKSRRSAQPQLQYQSSPRASHHRHLSSSATAVAAPPIPPKEKAYVPFDDRQSKLDNEFGTKRAASPHLFSGGKLASEKRVPSSSGSSHEYHRRGSSLNQTHHITYRQDSGDSASTATSPNAYKPQHFHSHSLSGATAVMQGGHYLSSAPSPAGLGIMLFPEPPALSRQDRYFDLREAMRLSIGNSRYKSFERGTRIVLTFLRRATSDVPSRTAVRRYNEQAIPLYGPGGLFDKVQRLLNEAVDDGLPIQTAKKYYQTFQSLILEA